MAHPSTDLPVALPPGPTLVRADAVPHEPDGPDFAVDLPVRSRISSLRAGRGAKAPHHSRTVTDVGTLADRVVEAADEMSMAAAAETGARLSRQDAIVLALAARARFADVGAEQERDALLTEVHAAALDLARRLRDHTLHCIVEYRGSHGAWDVVAECQATYAAHERYASVARRAAAQLRPRVTIPPELA